MSAASLARSSWARSYRTERIFEALASILVPSIETVARRSRPLSRASSRTCRKAASIAAALARLNTAIVSVVGVQVGSVKAHADNAMGGALDAPRPEDAVGIVNGSAAPASAWAGI